MLKLVLNTIRTLTRESHGTEIAEAAAVLPLMFTIILGIFWFGQAFRIYGTITRAAQEGARAGAAPYCTTCSGGNTAATNAGNAVRSALVAAHLDPAQILPFSKWTQPTMLDCSLGTPTSCQNVNNVCVQTRVQLSNPGAAGAVCGISVSFQYPYQFWLPFTTLSNQNIQLQAVARIRMEGP